jgi:hypothetical protein
MKNSIFKSKPMAQWVKEAALKPIPKMLFSEFWFESELCILYSDTNLGKSILAMQIGISISEGIPILGFKMEAQKQKILYFDFELSEKQIENRYSKEYENHYLFSENFIRSEIDLDLEISYTESTLNEALEIEILKQETKIIIIDNLTFLNQDNEKAKLALSLMKHLKALKNKHKLSILILAHTPKREFNRPITNNDLQGSKMLINFCDSSFSIGESHSDKNLRYLKQIKQRNTEQIYDAENVCVCQIDKPYNFLLFEFVNFGKELEHLKKHTEKDRDNLNDKVIELKQSGQSLREIGIELGISHMKVSRILKDCNTL